MRHQQVTADAGNGAVIAIFVDIIFPATSIPDCMAVLAEYFVSCAGHDVIKDK